jgi:hypothetical protein
LDQRIQSFEYPRGWKRNLLSFKYKVAESNPPHDFDSDMEDRLE